MSDSLPADVQRYLELHPSAVYVGSYRVGDETTQFYRAIAATPKLRLCVTMRSEGREYVMHEATTQGTYPRSPSVPVRQYSDTDNQREGK